MATDAGALRLPTWSAMSRLDRRVTAAFLAPLALSPFAIAVMGAVRMHGFAAAHAVRLAWLILGVPVLAMVGATLVMLPTIRRWRAERMRQLRRFGVVGLILWSCVVGLWPAALGWTVFFVVLALAVGFIASQEAFWDLWAGRLLRERDQYAEEERSLPSDLAAKLLFALTIWWAGVLVFPVLCTWRQIGG